MKKLAVRIFVLLFLVAVAYAGWRWGHLVFPRAEEAIGIGEGAGAEAAPDGITPEAAEAATARIEAFRDSDERELRLASDELSSMLRYSVPGMLPAGVIRPWVVMEEDWIEVRAEVLPEHVRSVPELSRIMAVLPDTVPVSARGSLLPFRGGRSMLLVDRMEVRSIPIPDAAIHQVLSVLGRRDEGGLPATAMLLPAVGSIKEAYIEDGLLVLVRA